MQEDSSNKAVAIQNIAIMKDNYAETLNKIRLLPGVVYAGKVEEYVGDLTILNRHDVKKNQEDLEFLQDRITELTHDVERAKIDTAAEILSSIVNACAHTSILTLRGVKEILYDVIETKIGGL